MDQPAGDAVGAPIARLEARQKVTGEGLYTDDIARVDMLHAALLGSPYPHARIRGVDVSAAQALPGVHAVITGADLPDHRLGVFIKDYYAIARDKVRFVGNTVAAVAAADLDTARRALGLIEVDYEELPAVITVEDALQADAPVLHEDYDSYDKIIAPATVKNVIAAKEFSDGDVDGAWSQCDVIVEGEYIVPAQHHVYLEPCTACAEVDPNGKITVWSSTQGVFGVQAFVADALGLPHSKVRSLAPLVGGGFGAKDELMFAPIAARLAQLTRRPVRLTLSREEDMGQVKSRHRGVVRMKTGAKADGTLVAREAEVILDGGAYDDQSAGVLTFAIMRTAGPYRIPNLHCFGRAVYTNHVPGGAFRGYGNPQATFAGESQLDELAEKLGIDPIELRIKNAKQSGDPFIGGTTIEVGSLSDCLREARMACDWDARRQQPRVCAPGKRRGLGAAAIWHLCGWFGGSATVRVREDGTVNLNTGAVDIGEGSDTALAQICAGALGLPVDWVSFTAPDTDASPWTFHTAGSRITYTVGHSVAEASFEARDQILEIAGELLECAPTDLELRPGGSVGVKGAPEAKIHFGDVARYALHRGEGEIVGSHRWNYHPHDVDPKRAAAMDIFGGTNIFGVQIVEIEVDEVTGKIEVIEVWSAHDVGKAINPGAVEGQIEGGVVQGLGYALTEEMLWEDGPLLNPTLMDYKVPGASDSPAKIHPIVLEYPDPRGPFGAKGVAEPGLVGIGPAIANALVDATGVRIRELPLTSQRVLSALLAR